MATTTTSLADLFKQLYAGLTKEQLAQLDLKKAMQAQGTWSALHDELYDGPENEFGALSRAFNSPPPSSMLISAAQYQSLITDISKPDPDEKDE